MTTVEKRELLKAIDEIRFLDNDHIWLNGRQFISLKRVGEIISEKSMTWGDKIRSMNNEELSNFMFEYGGSAPNCRENKLNHNCTSCNVCWFDWMKKTEGNK